jgi:ethanolamine ammonia-lyase small subunit
MIDVDPWVALKRFTDARIGLGRSGSGQPTREVLKFSLAHAMARDAVTRPMDWAPVEHGLKDLGLETWRVHSAAETRDIYLRRPDLGRQLHPNSRQSLTLESGPVPDLLIVIGDGLSSTAVGANAVPFMSAFLPYAQKNGWRLGPVLLAGMARVALGDEAGESLGAQAVAVLIGERPGLSSPDSLGVYLTFEPKVGRNDAERNCISNVRVGGLSHEEGAFKLAWLLREALRRRLTGVQLKDESNFQIEARSQDRMISP